MVDLVYTPGTDGSFIPLSKTQQGRLFKKELLHTGPLYHKTLPGGKIDIDAAFLSKVKENFDAGVAGIVQTTIVGKDNKHTEDPRDNIGEVIQVKVEGDSLYTYWDVRDEDIIPKMGKTILGASAGLALDWTDTRTGKNVGPAIFHAAATNNPHLNDLAGFEEVLALSVDSSSEAVLLTASPDNKENPPMPETLDDLITILKDEHDIDVRDLQAKAEAAPSAEDETLAAKLSAAIASTGVLTLSNGDEATAEDLVLAVGQLAEDKVELTNRIEALELSGKQSAAEATVDKFIASGHILPAKRDAQIKLFLSSEETFNELLPEQPVINLSGEGDGVIPVDTNPDETVKAEIDRLVAQSAVV